MRIKRFRFELRMKLAAQKPRVILQLDNLDKLSIRRFTRKHQTAAAQFVFVTRVELIPMPMPLANCLGAKNPHGQRAGLNLARISSKTHRSTHRLNADQVAALAIQLKDVVAALEQAGQEAARQRASVRRLALLSGGVAVVALIVAMIAIIVR